MEVTLLERLRFSPILVQMVPIRRCNLRCSYCNEYDRTSGPVPEEIMRARIDKVRSLGAMVLEFSGGEPLMHPAIARLVAHGTRHGFLTRWVITNGYLLDEDRVRALNDAGLTHLQLSLDGVEPSRRTAKTLRPLRPKLELLRRVARFHVRLNAVLGAAPVAEVKQVVDYAIASGFEPTVQLVHDHTGRLALSPEDRALLGELERFPSVASQMRAAGGYRRRLLAGESAPFQCRAGSRYLYVDEHGKVHWCSQQLTALARDLMTYTVADLRSEFHRKKPCTDFCTIGCVRTASKFDRWRAQAGAGPAVAST